MSEGTSVPVKKTTRTRKTTSFPAVSDTSSVSSKIISRLEDSFDDLMGKLAQAKTDLIAFQKEIVETKELWAKEKKVYEQTIVERNQQEALDRKREKETYDYEFSKKRHIEEDAFLEKKAKWEKDLHSQKEQIEAERRELGELRKQVAGFEAEKEKAVKEATVAVSKELTDAFTTEKKLREQEIKAERELLVLKITNLTSENTRQAQEIERLKKALDEATRELKDVAVKVIESSKPSSRQTGLEEK